MLSFFFYVFFLAVATTLPSKARTTSQYFLLSVPSYSCSVSSGASAFSFPLSSLVRTRALSFQQQPQPQHQPQQRRPFTASIGVLHSSFYERGFEEDNDDDDNEDNEDDGDFINEVSVADFRSKMDSLFGTTKTSTGTSSSRDEGVGAKQSAIDELIQFVRDQAKDSKEFVSSQTKEQEDWARPVQNLEPGVVLLADPAAFLTDFCGSNSSDKKTNPPRNYINPRLLNKFGLTLPPPVDLGADRRADLLPVLMVVQTRPIVHAVLLNRRTGYLLGDLEQPAAVTNNNDNGDDNDDNQPVPLLEKFCIQPLWFGGVDNLGGSSGGGGGLDMLHLCPDVPGAQKLTEDGMYWGGDPAQAQDCLDYGKTGAGKIYTGFDFKFFVQATVWNNLDDVLGTSSGNMGGMRQQSQQPQWYMAAVSKSVLFKSRDRMGTQRAKPLWTEIMELMGGQYCQVCQQLYAMDGKANKNKNNDDDNIMN